MSFSGRCGHSEFPGLWLCFFGGSGKKMRGAGAVGVTLEGTQDPGEAAPFQQGHSASPQVASRFLRSRLAHRSRNNMLNTLAFPRCCLRGGWCYSCARARLSPGAQERGASGASGVLGGQAGVEVGGSFPPPGASPLPAERCGGGARWRGWGEVMHEIHLSEWQVSAGHYGLFPMGLSWLVTLILAASGNEARVQTAVIFNLWCQTWTAELLARGWDGGVGAPGEIWPPLLRGWGGGRALSGLQSLVPILWGDCWSLFAGPLICYLKNYLQVYKDSCFHSGVCFVLFFNLKYRFKRFLRVICLILV